MPSSLREYIAAYDSAHPKPTSSSAPSSTSGTLDRGDHGLCLSLTDSIPSCRDSILSPSTSSSSVAQDMASPLDEVAITEPTPSANCRRNEHLAVLIPHYLWKADNLASHCDKYVCRVRFSLLQRKHHCRKCGGIYCHGCSSQTTQLLDTQKLPFHYPPPNKPITEFATPNAPVVNARICDDCWHQIHGTPAKPLSPSLPRDINNIPEDTCSSVSTLSPTTPPDIRPLFVRTISSSPRRRPTWPEPPVVQATKLEGDLDRYPLKDPSETCKAAGSGRWEPKQIPPRWDSRLPDGRLVYEVVADQRQEAERRRNANPVIVDGPIRVRKPSRPSTPSTPNRRSPCKLPTF